MTRTRRPTKTVLAFAMALVLVASATVAPVAAEDDVPLDSTESNESGVEVEVGGSAGGSSAGVECEVTSSTSELPCSTTGDDGGESPELPVGPTPGGEESPENSSGDDASTPGAGELPDDPTGSVGSALPGDADESLPLSTSTDLRPDDGVVRVSAVTETDRPAGTAVNCDLSSGWLRLCKVRNTAPAKASDLPQDQLPAIPDPVKEEAPVSYGLLFLLADTAVSEPNSMVGLAIGTAAGETPEESPVNPGNPPYNPNDPPVNLADPNGSVDPAVRRTGSGTPQPSGDWRSIRAVEAGVNDQIGLFLVGGAVQHDGTRYAGGAVGGSDGQNDYHGAVEVADDGRLWLNKDGFVTGNATLSQSEQRGGLAVDLGGQEYGQSFGGDGGGAPGLPVDPSQPPSSPADE